VRFASSRRCVRSAVPFRIPVAVLNTGKLSIAELEHTHVRGVLQLLENEWGDLHLEEMLEALGEGVLWFNGICIPPVMG
jgi:hypothetical protein